MRALEPVFCLEGVKAPRGFPKGKPSPLFFFFDFTLFPQVLHCSPLLLNI